MVVDPRPAQPQADRPARVRQPRHARLRVAGVLDARSPRRYSDNPSVMFDAFNEPYSRYNPTGRSLLLRPDLGVLARRRLRGAGRGRPDGDCRPGHLLRAGDGGRGRRDPRRRRRAADPARRPRLRQRPVPLARLRARRRPARGVVPQLRLQGRAPTPACWDDVLAPLADRVPGADRRARRRRPDRRLRRRATWTGPTSTAIGSLFWVWADHPDDPMALVRDESGAPTAYGAAGSPLPAAAPPPDTAVDPRPGRAVVVTPLWSQCGPPDDARAV